MKLKIAQILERFPLRVAVTDFCNVRCFFCSNEGMTCEQKNTMHTEVRDLGYLLETLTKMGLAQISITGGEPTLHPHLGEILQMVNATSTRQRFFHTNGIEMEKALESGELDYFSKIAVSTHAFEYDIWSKINHGTQAQYERLMKNLRELGRRGLNNKVEIKHVPMAGINDSREMLRKTLDVCSKYGFKFKFLNFEPIERTQGHLVIPINRVSKTLEQLGCEPIQDDYIFRGQSDYLPIKRYGYKGAMGVVIEIGCGDPEVCKACYKSNEIFVTPTLDLKPCHTNDQTIPLLPAIRNKDKAGILKRIVKSREFLYRRPGENSAYWRQKTA
ncbi:radical SAM protein [Candidatus Pacearchaeota archaeon]|nr:radical SAM protein [Candidatus Pacearchaeota archaeon]